MADERKLVAVIAWRRVWASWAERIPTSGALRSSNAPRSQHYARACSLGTCPMVTTISVDQSSQARQNFCQPLRVLPQ
jgi:hypothetical protein